MSAVGLQLWEIENLDLTSTSLDIKETPKEESFSRVKTSLKKWLWSSVAVVDVLILADLSLNHAGGLISIFLAITGVR